MTALETNNVQTNRHTGSSVSVQFFFSLKNHIMVHEVHEQKYSIFTHINNIVVKVKKK